MKSISLYTYMILCMGLFLLINIPQDIFTLRVIETVVIVVTTAVLLDALIIFRQEGKFRFPQGALITGLIISALIEPDLQNRTFYFIPPIFAILSKWLLRANRHNIFNPAAFGLLAMKLFYSTGIVTWWAANPAYLVFPIGLFIVYKMRGWHLAISFFLITMPLYAIYGMVNQIAILDSLGLINYYFAFFMLTEHKSAPMSNKSRVMYGGFIGGLSFLFYVFIPDIENSLTALLIGNACVPLMNKLLYPNQSSPPGKT